MVPSGSFSYANGSKAEKKAERKLPCRMTENID